MATNHRIAVGDGEVAAVHHATGGDRWLFFCHGLRSDKAGSYEGRCERAVAEGYDAVRFDARGCGESSGRFVDHGLSDRLADLRAVRERFDPPTHALFGSSFGGTVALHDATRGGAAAVATRAPVTDTGAFAALRETVERAGRYEFDTGETVDGRFFAALDAHPFEAVVDGLDVPVAVWHGGADGSVPVTDSLDAAAALETDVLVEKFAGEEHRFSRAAEGRLRDRLFDWLGRVYPARP